MKIEPRGLVLLFPFQCNSIFVYYIKTQRTFWLWGQPHLPLTQEFQKSWTGIEGFWWPLTILGQGLGHPPRSGLPRFSGCPRLVWCFSWDAWNTILTSLEKSHLSGFISWLTRSMRFSHLPLSSPYKFHLHSPLQLSQTDLPVHLCSAPA